MICNYNNNDGGLELASLAVHRFPLLISHVPYYLSDKRSTYIHYIYVYNHRFSTTRTDYLDIYVKHHVYVAQFSIICVCESVCVPGGWLRQNMKRNFCLKQHLVATSIIYSLLLAGDNYSGFFLFTIWHHSPPMLSVQRKMAQFLYINVKWVKKVYKEHILSIGGYITFSESVWDKTGSNMNGAWLKSMFWYN